LYLSILISVNALRLVDREDLSQKEAGERKGVFSGTVCHARLYHLLVEGDGCQGDGLDNVDCCDFIRILEDDIVRVRGSGTVYRK
jgi:hypothetical protein